MQHVLSPMIDLMASKLRQELSQLLSGDDPPTTVSWYGLLVYIRTFAEINIIIQAVIPSIFSKKPSARVAILTGQTYREEQLKKLLSKPSEESQGTRSSLISHSKSGKNVFKEITIYNLTKFYSLLQKGKIRVSDFDVIFFDSDKLQIVDEPLSESIYALIVRNFMLNSVEIIRTQIVFFKNFQQMTKMNVLDSI